MAAIRREAKSSREGAKVRFQKAEWAAAGGALLKNFEWKKRWKQPCFRFLFGNSIAILNDTLLHATKKFNQ